jgi:hypothetical protein
MGLTIATDFAAQRHRGPDRPDGADGSEGRPSGGRRHRKPPVDVLPLDHADQDSIPPQSGAVP